MWYHIYLDFSVVYVLTKWATSVKHDVRCLPRAWRETVEPLGGAKLNETLQLRRGGLRRRANNTPEGWCYYIMY